MEGWRVSKLEEGQQWGKNTSSKDKVQWGRRSPFIGGEKSNRYAHTPHRAVLPLVLTVLLLGVAVLPLRVAVLLLASGTKKYICAYHRWTCDEFLVPSGSSHGSSRGSTAPKSGTKKLHPQQPLLRTPKLTQLLQTDSEFEETKFVGKLATRANTILIEISRISK